MCQIYQLVPLLAFYLSDHQIAPLQKSLRSTACAVLKVGEWVAGKMEALAGC